MLKRTKVCSFTVYVQDAKVVFGPEFQQRQTQFFGKAVPNYFAKGVLMQAQHTFDTGKPTFVVCKL